MLMPSCVTMDNERMISFLFLIVNASLAAAEILFGSE